MVPKEGERDALGCETCRDQSQIERGRYIKLLQKIWVQKRLAHLYGDLHRKKKCEESRIGAMPERREEVREWDALVRGPLLRVALFAKEGDARRARGGREREERRKADKRPRSSMRRLQNDARDDECSKKRCLAKPAANTEVARESLVESKAPPTCSKPRPRRVPPSSRPLQR